jgi:hypothetical protein
MYRLPFNRGPEIIGRLLGLDFAARGANPETRCELPRNLKPQHPLDRQHAERRVAEPDSGPGNPSTGK